MLQHSEATLPSSWYFDPDHFYRELESIWYRDWVCLGHETEWAEAGQFRRFRLGDQQFFVTRDRSGALRAFHNTCRHRGAELCQAQAGRFPAGRVVCPYHGWAYGLDGELLALPKTMQAEDFDRDDFPLYPVALDTWRGFVFVNLDPAPRQTLTEAVGDEAHWLERWPLETLALAYRDEHDIACNWKIFWENYNECCHCPVVHKDLVRLVPHYGKGLNERHDLPEDSPLRTRPSPLADGAVTWSENGQTDLPWFEGLGEAERAAGMTFSTVLPGIFLVGHVDYLRTVRVLPRGPERTRLVVDWFVAPEAINRGELDVERLIAFGNQVVREDALVCEINQRGLHSRAHRQGVLTPPEYDVLEFQTWVRGRLGE